jgi:hypothetical protein
MADRQRRLDLGFDGEKAVRGVPQENQPEDGHGILRGIEMGVCPELVGSFPKVGFKLAEFFAGHFKVFPASARDCGE